MVHIDAQQFNEENKLLFQDGRWFIFLDLGDGLVGGFSPRLAHLCEPEEREKYGEPWIKMYSCCIAIADNQVCRDCRAPVPRVFQGFFNLTKWSFE